MHIYRSTVYIDGSVDGLVENCLTCASAAIIVVIRAVVITCSSGQRTTVHH